MSQRSPPSPPRKEEGPEMIENGLIVALICMIIVGLVLAMGPGLWYLFT